MADSNSSSSIGSERFEAAEDNALVWSVSTTLPGAWRYRVSTGTGRPGVSIL